MRKNLPVTGNEHILPDGVMLVSKTDLKGRITFANDAFVTASGFSVTELMGKAHNIVRHPDMPEGAFADLWRTLEAGKPWTGLVKNRRKNGDHYWVHANATPIREGGRVTGYMSVRSKPARDQVDAAEAAYRLFRENRAGRLVVHEGKVVSSFAAGPWNLVARTSLRQKFAFVGAVVAVPVMTALAAILWPSLSPLSPTALAALLASALVFGMVLFLRIGWRLSGTLAESAVRVEELAQGSFDRIFDARGEDEVAQLQRALQSLRTKVGFELADSRRKAVESTRIRQALDVAAANVMVADASHDIIYTNRSLQEMLSRSESDIRRELPAFSADKVVGGNVDQFHAQPEHQRQMLSRLVAAHRTRLTFGERRVDLVITPIVGEADTRIGTVVEWTDRTAELSTEAEVELVVKSANDGDLTRRIRTDDKAGFFASLSGGLNSILDANAKLVRDVQEATRAVASGAEEISIGNLSLSQRTEQQAASLEETASSMEQMTSTVKHNADNAALASQLASQARASAENGGAVVSGAIAAMQEINAASSKIADIIGVIDEIAFQTNLLALNAAVEAARAGDQGRGFAVVAAEVRSLASRSAEAAKEIKALIYDTVGRVEHGAKLVDQSGQTLTEIVASVKKVNDIVAEIASASGQQSAGIEEVNKAVISMDEVTQQNAALVEEAAAAAQALLDRSQDLSAMMGSYRVKDGNPSNAPKCLRAVQDSRREERRSGSRPSPDGGSGAAATIRQSRARPAGGAGAAAGGDWSEF